LIPADWAANHHGGRNAGLEVARRGHTRRTHAQQLEAEANELTEIANAHLLRHSELKQAAVTEVDQVDYLFHRLFAMIHLLLKRR
jgi:hypothetical protein